MYIRDAYNNNNNNKKIDAICFESQWEAKGRHSIGPKAIWNYSEREKPD